MVGWQLSNPQEIGLLDVVQNAKPTVLIGVSGQAGAFTEEIIRAMAKSTDRPVIFPLSNPTSRAEATPQQAAKGQQVSDSMIKASAIALAELAPTRQSKSANLLPPLAGIRSVSLAIAKAVGKQAIKDGSATVDDDQFEQELAANIWEPVYEPYERV